MHGTMALRSGDTWEYDIDMKQDKDGSSFARKDYLPCFIA